MDQAPRSAARILLIEDAPDIRQLATTVLEHEGHAVTAAASGEEGLSLARSVPPDLILLNAGQQGLDGYEVCCRFKQDEVLATVPVIFMGDQNDEQAQTRGFDAGAVDYIAKPLAAPLLRMRVRTHIALHMQQYHLETLFRDALESAPDAIILADAQGRIVQINAQTLALFGYRHEELAGQSVAGLITPSQQAAGTGLQAAPTAPAPGERRLGVSAACLRRDGSVFIGDISLAPLHTRHGPLTMTVVRDVTESRRIQQEMIDSRQRLRELAAQGDALREYERKNIAREIHDELGQLLTALRMDLTYVDMKFGIQGPELKERTQNMRKLVDQSIHAVRNVTTNLRPSALDMGLVPALEWLCGEFRKHAGIPCTLSVGAQPVHIPERQAVVLFRIVQESLTNVSRYAHASGVQVTLALEDALLTLQVIDDGQGFDIDTAAHGKSFGLLGMQERALALGGELSVDSIPGRGTTVTARIPWDEPPAEQEAP